MSVVLVSHGALKKCTGLVNEGTQLEGGLTRTHPGHRRLRSRNSETTYDPVRAAGQNQKEDARSQVLQEVWGDHEQDCQGGSHAERRLRLGGACHSSTQGDRSRGGSRCTSATRFTDAVWDEQLDDVELHKALRRQ